MCKTFFKAIFLSVFISTFSLADDILARLTNGALSDKSAGVKVLTQEEASQVVGGYYVYGGDRGYIIFENINANLVKYAEIGVIVGFSSYEIANRTSCGLGVVGECRGNVGYYHAQNAYQKIILSQIP